MDIVSDSNDQIIVLAGTTLYRLNPTLKTYSKIADSPLPLPASMRRIMRDKAGNIYSKVYLGPDVFPNPSYELYKMPVGTNTWQTKPVGITGGGNANFIFDEANDPYIFFNDVVAGTWDIAKILR